MTYKQGGLAHFQEGKSVDSGLSQSVPVKVSPGKSAISPAGNVNLDPEQISGLLENMRKLEAERSGPMNRFIEGLQEASVWGSGGAEGPGANLIALRRQKALEREERLGQMERMSALEASQQKAASDAAFVNQLLGGGRELPGKVSTAGGAPSMSPTTAFTDQTIPPQVKQRMLAAGNATAAKAVYDEWLKGEIEKSTAFKYSADMQAPVEVPIGNRMVTMTREQFAERAKKDPEILALLGRTNPQLANQIKADIAGQPGVGAARPTVTPAAPTAPAAGGAPRPTAGGSSMVVPPAPGVGGGFKTAIEEDVKLRAARLNQANEAVLKTQYTPLAETVNAQKDAVLIAENVLDAIETGNYGPGSDLNQKLMQGLQAIGVKLSGGQEQQYLNNLTIEQAKRLFVSKDARAAMGAQFTQVESERFEKTLAGITDPKQYIKNVYQLKIATAIANKEKLKFLDKNLDNLPAAIRIWDESGEEQRILNENVDYLRERAAKKQKQKTGEAKPSQKTVARTGKVTNRNSPDFGKTVTEYSDGTREIK